MFVTPNDKKTFQAIFVLDYLTRGNIKTVANGDDKFLEPILIELMSKGYIRTSGIDYVTTPKGDEVLSLFMKRYTEYLRLYDVFGFVDLDAAEFAFAKYFDFDSDAQWDSFKSNPRFEDVRIAVAMFKKLNPAEIVFMSFINEGRFDTASTGWQIDLLSDAIWNEIEEICATALKPEQLGDDAMADLTEQGCRLAVSLIEEEAKMEAKRIKENASSTSLGAQYYDVTVHEETIVFEESYEPYYAYYDPFYISPFWLVPLILW
jgi:hypothetical protein